MTDSLTEVPPAARRALLELANAPTVPVKVLITGGIGTGKTTVLAAARDTLRRSGLTVLACPPPDGEPPETALVIDDAQLLTDTELLRLTERVADSRLTVVAAAEAREHHRALRALTMALERDRPRISLGPLPVAEHLRDCTAGLPFLIHAVSARAQAPAQAAKVALIERLRRLDEPTLDTLLMMSLTHELGVSDVAAALGISVTDARGLVDRAHASGLIESSHTAAFLQSVHDAIAQIVGNAHHHEVETSLLRSQLDISPVSAELALRLAEHGLRDERLSSPDATERAAAVRVAASVAVHDGNTGHAAELFGWLGPHPDTMVSSAATIVFAANGDLATARATLRLKDAGPPTMAARCARNLAEGLLLTMDQPYPVAMAKLGQAIATEQSLSQVIPDSPAALVTLAAIHAGDPVRARSVIGRAVRAGADPLFQRRHLLLSGWIKMQEGQLPSASADVAAASAGTHLHRRDALWAAALQTAISRRTGDIGALQQHWYAAMEALAEYSLDLFALLPLGELWVAAARMRQVDQLQHTLDQALTLLDSLGNPALWSNSLHWAGVHAGILANSPESVAPHGQALGAMVAHSTLAQALSDAGRTWLRVLAENVDADEVTAAARSLSHVGLTSDATRLAGQAALQTSDARVSGAMLQLARDLKLGNDFGEPPSGAGDTEPASGTPPAPRQPPAGSPLSDREREVAELLLLGMPYRDIGARLFISAKTVEHHVARIRQRLGAGSRSEMLSMLRAMLAPESLTADERR